MAITLTKIDQGLNKYTGTGFPTNNGSSGDEYTDTLTGFKYQYTTSWEIVALGVAFIPQSQNIYVDSENGINTTDRGNINKPYLSIEYALTNTINTGTITATTTNNNITLSVVSDTTDIKIGQFITGSGITYGSQVVSKTLNTIVLSKPCIVTGSTIATWWSTYNVICVGSFTVVSNIYKHGFYIDTKTYNATINFGAFVLFMLTSNALIPICFQLGKTNGTHANSKIHTTNGFSAVNCDIWYGNAYSIGTDRMFGNAWNYSGICNIEGNYADARFGHVAYFDTFNTLTWKGNAYGLLGGIITAGAGQASIDTNIVTPVSVAALSFYSGASLYGSVRGNIIGVGMVSIHSNIIGNVNLTAHVTGSSVYGSIIGNVLSTGLVNYYGFIYGNMTVYTTGNWDGTNIFQAVYGTITVSSGSCSVHCVSPINGNHFTTIVIGTGTFINNGVLTYSNFTFTGNGKYINNGTVHVGIGTNSPPASVISNGGSFINNPTGVVRYDGTEIACLMTKSNGILVNNGRMVNTSKLYVNYSANTSASKDIIIQNSFTNGNGLNGGVGKGTGNIMWINTTLANTNTAVTIFDGTNTVTISVTGAGKSVEVINAEIVTLIKASVLLFQCCEILWVNEYVYFIGLQSISTTATSLVNATTGTQNGGGGLSFVPNILVAGTEINNENLNY